MKHLTYFALAMLAILSSCNKKIPPFNYGTFDYKASGEMETSIPSNGEGTISQYFKLLSGNAETEPLQFTVSKPHDSIFLQIYSGTFRLNWSIYDSVFIRNAPYGDYPVYIDVTSASTGTRHYTWIIHVDSTIDRVGALVGRHYRSNTCVNTSVAVCTIYRIADTSLRFMMVDSLGVGNYDTTYGVADNYHPNFVIPSQNVHGTIVSGYGSLSYHGIDVHKTIVTDTATYNCAYTLSKLL